MVDNRENNIWTVYIHIIPKEISDYDYDKYYVGITSQSVKRRWRDGNGYRNQPFYRAIQKYGWDNIEHEIIASHLTENEAKEFEKRLIQLLDCNIGKGKRGYNTTDGGDGMLGHVASEEARKKYSEITTKRNLEKYKTKIYKFSDLGVFIEQFDHMYLACKSVNGSSGGGILNALNNKQSYAYGYIWRYEKDIYIDDKGNIYPTNLYINKSEMFIPIYCFDAEGKFINKLSSTLIDKDNNIYIAQKAINDHYTTYKGCFYRKAYDVISINGIPHMKDEDKILANVRNRRIYVFDKKNKTYIKEYKDINDFKIGENITTSTYKNYLAGYKCSHNSKYYRYGKDVGFTKNGEAYFIA